MKSWLKKRFALTNQGASDLIKSSIASFACHFANMLPIIILMIFLDQLLNTNIKSNSFYIGFSIIILVVMFIVKYIEYNMQFSATYKESENLRIEIARTMSQLPLSYFSKHDLSDLSQTIMSDVSGLEHALSHAICQYIGYLFFFAISSIMMLIGNFKLGLVVIIPILLNYLLLYLSKKFEFINSSDYYNKLRQNSDEFQETIEMQQEIKSLGLGEEIKNKLSKDMEESEKIHIKTELKSAIILNLAGISLYLSLVGILTFGVNMLINKEINLLFFIGYLLAAMKFKEGSENISQNIAEIFVIDDMVNRINEIRNTPIQEGADANLDNFDILFKNVDFSYDKNTKVLDNINFMAKQGQITALVGKSGCGKTSILRLISRLYDYDNGLIEISGKDIKEISTKSLFEKISIVFQDVTLFNSTILDNIRIGNINASDEEVIKAAKMANCEEFINRLPEKYNTLISENGNALSGGERQRISIARAFLKNAPIIILDEISASLDIENEKKIQESLNKLIKNKTVIIISHRLKSIENVDEIVVMEDGKIESVGTNKELLEKSKAYNNLILNNQMVENFVYE